MRTDTCDYVILDPLDSAKENLEYDILVRIRPTSLDSSEC